MKRNAKIKLVPAETIVPGKTYMGCLHGDTSSSKRSVVVVCEEQEFDNTDKSDSDCYTCRFENGNTYPYIKEELFVLVAEYDVPSLANPRKMIGTNTIELDWSDYKWMTDSAIVDTPSRTEIAIDFNRNNAKVTANPKRFSLTDVLNILDDLKMNNDDTLHNQKINMQILTLKQNYLW
jgi:hypothetical protein